MTRTIYKYKLRPGQNSVFIDIDAEFISVANQDNELVVWAIQNIDKKKEQKIIDVIVTGQAFDHAIKRKFIGTVLLDNGDFVAHIFERVN